MLLMQKTRRSVLIGCLLVLGFLSVHAQRQNHYFYGKILDADTRYPVPSANIRFSGTETGSSTNSKGDFSFFVDTIPVYMYVSHLGYETQKIWLDNTSSSIIVMLRPESRMLREVEITAKNKPILFFKDKHYSVLDFEVDSSRIYLVIFRYRLAEAELLCLSHQGDTLGQSGPLPFKPRELFRDCLGNMHILSSDSAYQVFQDSTNLRLLYPAEIDRFKKSLEDCVASAGNLLYFKQLSRDGMQVTFFAVNTKTRKRKTIAKSLDEERRNLLMRNPDDRGYLMRTRIPDGREAFERYNWIKKIVYKPNSSTLHRIGDLLCAFNTADGTLELYTLTGDFTAKLKMPVDDIRNEGRWTKEIYVDHVDEKAYTSFIKGGEFALYRINLNNGSLKHVLDATHGFPRKVRVNNFYLFYLYDVPGLEDNRHIFKQKL
jgi:hypothetical protein